MPLVSKRWNLSLSQNKSLYNVKQEKEEYISQDLERVSMGGGDDQNNDVNEGRWSDQQNFKFIMFVSYYQGIFSSKCKRKNSKIFKTLSEYMNQRTPAQCRSHFQKLLVKFKTVAKIKKHYLKLYGKEQFMNSLSRFKQDWEHRSQQTLKSNTTEVKEFGVQTEEVLVKKEIKFGSFPFIREMLGMYPLWNGVKFEEYTNPYILNFNH